jgi:hypothetical protein
MLSGFQRDATMSIQQITESVKRLSTIEAAEVLKVRPQTLRAALCRDGHYLGARPAKSANRFLLWNAADIERLAAGEILAAKVAS